MKDFKAISTNIKNKFKVKLIGKGDYGNEAWRKADYEWYQLIHDTNYLLHEDFIKYINSKKDIKTVLEVGCGTGVYPIKHRELFQDKNYTGIDISKENIEYCKNNSKFEFECGDFIKMNLEKKYDLVYTHAVIDHVYDIEAFLSKIVSTTTKYAYINAYRGYFPELKKHQLNWNEKDRCAYNNISIIQAKEDLVKMGLKENEFIIRSQKSGQIGNDESIQPVIEITKI